MDVSKLALNTFRTMLILYIGLLNCFVISNPALVNSYSELSSNNNWNLEQLDTTTLPATTEIDTYTTAKHKLSMREKVLLGEMLANSVLKTSEPSQKSRYRRLCEF